MDLTPSQVIRKSPKNGDRRGSQTESLADASKDRAPIQDQPSNNKGQKKRHRGRKKKQEEQPGGKDTSAAEKIQSTVEHNSSQQQPNESNAKQNEHQKPKKRNRNRQKGSNNSNTNRENPVGQQQQIGEQQSRQRKNEQPQNGEARKRKNRNNRNRNKDKTKESPWKSKVPEDAVDPITLDHIRDLEYPPFALVANEPYIPIEEWPIPDQDSSIVLPPRETEEERQRRILAEQWGEQHATGATADRDEKSPLIQHEKRHVNLYDGRALAYYMVSQLQFIDPLNRRDLTRDEINNLDSYLRRHGFHDLNVTEAYDAKGITLSTAGAAANTAAGRAAILQQEARNLLNALFGNSSVAHPSSAPNSNTLMQQYLAHEAASTERHGRRQRSNNVRSQQSPVDNESGIYGGAGFVVIDDTLNPGLRTEANPDPIENQEVARTSSLWSSSHITQQHGSGGVPRAWEFPSLSTVAQQLPKPSEAPRSSQQVVEKKPPSKTLAKIGSAVKKTDPEEVQRQFEAREEARRRAMMSNLTFGSNPSAMGVGITNAVPTEISAVSVGEGPSIEQLNRNRAFAEALGVVPSTVRGYSGSLNSGWARPSEGLQLDEFGNELNTTIYPDSLILQAREKIAVLLKLEKKWKMFLADDTSASLPLNKMDRPTRAMVHEYAAFWKLHTESFDPEPRRYIHCVKLQETRAPFPLLSDAARSWRGPTYSLNRSDHPLQQTAGQNTEGRSIPAPPERIPLSLKPRSEAVPTDNVVGSTQGIALGGVISLSMQEQDIGSSRFAVLGRERPKLELQERTLPLELPAKEEEYDVKKDLANQRRRAEEKRQKEREEAERKQRLLEAAFASDDEESVRRVDDDSDWEEQAPLYTDSEDS